MKILFVCTGNLCRSPMAEAMLRHELDRRACAEIEVASAGTWAVAGGSATETALDVLRAHGIELHDHRPRSLDPDEVRSADIVVAMTSVHVNEILSLVPEARGRVILLKEIAEIGAAHRGGDPAGRLEKLLLAERPSARRALDIDDPMGLPRSAYERTRSDLEAGISVLADVLCPTEGSPGRETSC